MWFYKISLFLILSLLINANATLSPQKDGISYQVLSAKEMSRPDLLHCGRNDLGLILQGLFKVEERRYIEYKHNKIIKTWSEKVDVFVACYNP